MPVLRDILYRSGIRAIHGSTDIDIRDIQIDSRKVQRSSLFIAVKGLLQDGHAYIPQAVKAGATAVVAEEPPQELPPGVTWVQVENATVAAGFIAHQFFGMPSSKLKLVGVTGTNGKTTIATLLYKLFTALGYRCGLISTVQNIVVERTLPSTHTTPDAIALNALLAEMADAGCSHVFMESSSHAIHQNRIAGLVYAGGVFSNITHDHLDYHGTFDEYIRVKKSFFDQLPSQAFALSNADDKRGGVMVQNTPARKYYYGLKSVADFKGKILDNALTGLMMLVDDVEVSFRMIGTFNAYNLLAVYGAAVCLGEDKQEVLLNLSMLTGAEGRFDYLISEKDHVMGIIDYAHTPDALLNVLMTISTLRKGEESVITVVGCGGDRDRAKRPLMAQVACQHSDKVILTSDNPRSEEPQAILEEMESGIPVSGKRKALLISDRREAIKTAISVSKPGDIILVAGKGHEKYQEIKGVRHPFDDKQVLTEMFRLMGK